jgi:acid phosphatase (class A)
MGGWSAWLPRTQVTEDRLRLPALNGYEAPAGNNRSKMTRFPRPALAFAAFLLLGAHGASSAEPKPQGAFYIEPSQVDLDYLLAPPPALGSAAEAADLAMVVAAQKNRSAEDVVAAEADHHRTVFRFANVMGARFAPARLPFATEFFLRVYADEARIVDATKVHFNRPRPFMVDSSLMPMVYPKPTPSYPSGHTTFAYVNAILLARMVPEKAAAIFERAAVYGNGRIVVGAHFPTDVEAGKIAGAVIDSVFFSDPKFMKDFDRARIEVRHALGLA